MRFVLVLGRVKYLTVFAIWPFIRARNKERYNVIMKTIIIILLYSCIGENNNFNIESLSVYFNIAPKNIGVNGQKIVKSRKVPKYLVKI